MEKIIYSGYQPVITNVHAKIDCSPVPDGYTVEELPAVFPRERERKKVEPKRKQRATEPKQGGWHDYSKALLLVEDEEYRKKNGKLDLHRIADEAKVPYKNLWAYLKRNGLLL